MAKPCPGLWVATVAQHPQQGQSQQGWALAPGCPLPSCHPSLLSLSQREQRVLHTSGMRSGRERRQLLGWGCSSSKPWLGYRGGLGRVTAREEGQRPPPCPGCSGVTRVPVPASPGKLNPSPQPRHDPAHPQTLPGPPASASCSGRAEFPSRPSVLPALMETSALGSREGLEWRQPDPLPSLVFFQICRAALDWEGVRAASCSPRASRG